MLEGATSPIIQTYTSSNKILNRDGNVSGINNRGVLLIEKDNTHVKSHIYTLDGDTTTNLFSASDAYDGTNDYSYSANEFMDYFCPEFKIMFESSEKYVYFIIKYDNSVIASTLDSLQDSDYDMDRSGKNIVIKYPDDTIAYCIDGVFTKTSEIYNYADETSPDNASGVIFAIYDNTPYRVKIVSSTGVFNVDISLSDYQDYDMQNDFFFMTEDNVGVFKVTFIDKEGNQYYYEDPLGRTNIYRDSIYNTDSSMLFEIYNNDDDTRFYVIFDYESKTYTTLEQPPNLTNRRTVRSNYDYQWD
jgi:hypothetical protein